MPATVAVNVYVPFADIVNTAPLDAAPPLPAAGFVGSAIGVLYVVPAGTTSLVATLPVLGILTYALAASFTKVFTGTVNTIVVVGQLVV